MSHKYKVHFIFFLKQETFIILLLGKLNYFMFVADYLVHSMHIKRTGKVEDKSILSQRSTILLYSNKNRRMNN
ncbi:hypothetical protein NPIL_463841 [Nephila pilipes]|uniref:Uncharacterized protein n=1 Tax=Nephila pilipes TaxID=299642 RepID=A0A8X6NW25_NEPPI|nr:hypothetical protein NPIL_463841 [Nephila pilipes]